MTNWIQIGIEAAEAVFILAFVIVYFVHLGISNSRHDKKFKKLFEEINESNKKVKLSEWQSYYLKEDFRVFYGCELTISFIKIGTKTADGRLGWMCYNELVNRVVMNTFDEYGKCREVLDSIHSMFKNIRTYTIECVGANKALPICLYFLNKILRPFCAKWNRLLTQEEAKCDNEDKYNWDVIGNEQREVFASEYDELKNKIKKDKIIEKLAHLGGINITLGAVLDNAPKD